MAEKTFLTAARITEWSRCGRSTASVCILYVHMFTLIPFSKAIFLGWLPGFVCPCTESQQVLGCRWCQLAAAWCRPGAALIYQIKPCVRRQSPASFCSLHLGHNQDLAASPLSSLCDLASFAVSGAARVCLVAQALRCHPCVLSRFGQMHWLNMIENLVDLPF